MSIRAEERLVDRLRCRRGGGGVCVWKGVC
jgi:hypothetical protein